MNLPSSFYSSRLHFRRPRKEDAPAILAGWAADPEVTRYLVWQPHREVGTVEQYIESCHEGWRQSREFTWLIAARASDQPMGAIAARPSGHRIEIGYVLGRPWWRHGYMTETVLRLIEECFRLEAVHRVWAYCDCENPASARVMEKSGMIREGRLHAWAMHPNVSSLPRDCWAYAITKGGSERRQEPSAVP